MRLTKPQEITQTFLTASERYTGFKAEWEKYHKEHIRIHHGSDPSKCRSNQNLLASMKAAPDDWLKSFEAHVTEYVADGRFSPEEAYVIRVDFAVNIKERTISDCEMLRAFTQAVNAVRMLQFLGSPEELMKVLLTCLYPTPRGTDR